MKPVILPNDFLLDLDSVSFRPSKRKVYNPLTGELHITILTVMCKGYNNVELCADTPEQAEQIEKIINDHLRKIEKESMKEPTKEQVPDALQTHKTVQKAAKALGVKYPEMQKYLKRYGIKTILAMKLPPLPCKPAFEQKIEAPVVKQCTRKEIENKLFRAMKLFRELRHIPSEEEMKKRSERAKKLFEQEEKDFDACMNNTEQVFDWYTIDPPAVRHVAFNKYVGRRQSMGEEELCALNNAMMWEDACAQMRNVDKKYHGVIMANALEEQGDKCHRYLVFCYDGYSRLVLEKDMIELPWQGK